MDRKFIEETFPIKEISLECKKEQDTRKPTIADIHLWWARRPIAASRSTIYASLISDIIDPENKKIEMEFMHKFSELKNFTNQNFLKKARTKISSTNPSLKILDPFAGGGSIPFEALNLGCESYACDYNPVAFIILKSIMEFPQKFTEKNQINKDSLKTKPSAFMKDYKYWCDYLYDEAKKELGNFYGKDPDGSEEVACIRAHCLNCFNPSCGKLFPLVKQFWLSNNRRKIAFYLEKKSNDMQIKIVGDGYNKFPLEFDPSKGTVKRGVAECPYCKTIIDAIDVKNQFMNNKIYDIPLVVVTHSERNGKNYRSINETDEKNYQKVSDYLIKKKNELRKKWNMEPIPDEPVPPKNSHRAVGSQLPLYGIKNFGQLYTQRQILSMLILTDKIRDIYQKIKSKVDDEYAKIIVTYLALLVSKHSSYNAKLCWWESTGERVFNVFGRQTFAMVYDYSEQNPFGILTGNISKLITQSCDILEQIINCGIISGGNVLQSSALKLPFSSDYFDAVFTDPPYYDNIPYSYLSDFFYVWLKRSIGHLYPSNFSTPLTPKFEEIVAYQNSHNINPKETFEEKLKESFKEIYRVLKPDGIGYVVYTHKSTEGWESLINSLLDSGFTVTASWPINTEMTTRLGANETASLASSIYMIIRKLKKEPTGFYREIKLELKKYLNKKLDHLWRQNVGGADFFISAIGSSIEVFGKYDKVVDDSDNLIHVSKLLDDIREIVTNYAIRKVLHSEFSDEISQMTRFYILWRWAYGGASVPFNDALKMAQSVGIDIEHQWNKGFFVKEKENIRVLGPDEREIEDLEKSHELIDVLHYALILWKKNKKEELDKFLKKNNYEKSDMFKRVSQAISESLATESTEKKWLDGFLTRFRVDDSNTSQTKLF